MPKVTFDGLLEQRTKAQEAAKAIADLVVSEDRDFTDEEKTKFDELIAERDSLGARLDRLQKLNDNEPDLRRVTQPEPIRQEGDPSPGPTTRTDLRIEIPDYIRRGHLRGYTRERFGADHELRAYKFGRAFFAYLGHPRSMEWCRDHGVEVRVQKENVNWNGGALVLDGFDNDIIRLVEAFGVFRQYARVVPMNSDVMSRSRRTGGLTAYVVGEDTAGTESTMTWDTINLVAKKWMVLTTISSELNEDAIVSVGDQVMTEMAYAFANKEDDCGFNGDGTSTYGGIVGVRSAFTNLTATIANIAGLVVGAGNLFSELTLANFNSVVSLLPAYADTPNARWFVHKTVYGATMQTLQYAAGGNDTSNIGGGTGQTFLGYPVVFCQVMPKTDANSQVCAILGDLSLAADLGDRRGTTISVSDTAYVGSRSCFENDSLAIKATTRYDINVHDVGNQSATAASRQPGPVVGLISAAS